MIFKKIITFSFCLNFLTIFSSNVQIVNPFTHDHRFVKWLCTADKHNLLQRTQVSEGAETPWRFGHSFEMYCAIQSSYDQLRTLKEVKNNPKFQEYCGLLTWEANPDFHYLNNNNPFLHAKTVQDIQEYVEKTDQAIQTFYDWLKNTLNHPHRLHRTPQNPSSMHQQ
ncbi:hypothetical protein KAZ82_02190 [Candidatus Babeliales bacterium]|nr:hypothetical protein [Candidatus Babeliales bacterium]